MSIEFNIDESFRWHVRERKEIDIRVLDAEGLPVDLAGRTMRWTLGRTRFDRYPYLEMNTSLGNLTAIAHEDDEYDVQSVAHIEVVPEDYALVLRAGKYRHELIDQSDDLVLSEGYVVLLPAMNPQEVS